MAVFLYLEGISSIYVLTAFAYIGAFVGDQSSYLMGRIFGSKMLKWNIFKKRTKQVEKTVLVRQSSLALAIVLNTDFLHTRVLASRLKISVKDALTTQNRAAIL